MMKYHVGLKLRTSTKLVIRRGARQIAANPDAAPDMAPEIDVRAIRRANAMTQAQFAAAYEFSLRTLQEWERGAKRPSGPARTLLRAIKGDPEGLRRALAVG